MAQILLVHAVAEKACNRGARIVEAYPVDPQSPSYRFMGLKGMLAEAGFEELGPVGTRRLVMRLML